MRAGVRVVRGPQWRWGDQDGGEGYVGTVVELPATAPKTCIVQWDCKPMMNYRAGLSSRYDLRVFDSAPSGVKHDHTCTGCNDRVICGILWSCAECDNVHLCTFCYMNDKHSVSHKFRRVYDQGSLAVLLPPRRLCQKIDSYGVFQSAGVRRGRDWNWDNQDGEGPGVVTSLQGWSEESSRSVVCVQWQNGATNVYRMGHRGKTDLIAFRPAKGWPYYVEHLPNFGEEIVESRLPIFTIGETVKVDSNVTRVKKLSEGHGQWHENMRNYIGATGTVHRITENDDVRIIFNDKQKWTYNSKAITKIFRLNDKVMLTSDSETLREYHGDAFNQLEMLRGVHGIIKETRPEACLYVVSFQNGVGEYIHGNCLYAVDTANRLFNALAEEQLAAAAAAGVSGVQRTLVQHQLAPPPMEVAYSERASPSTDNLAEFFTALDQGQIDKAREMLTNFSDLANAEFNDRKALIAAAYSGKAELLRLLTQCGADVSAKDQMGDSVVHVAVKKRHLHLLPVFVEPAFQSVINCTNRVYDTPLHTSVKMGYIEAVKCLLQIPGISGTLKDREGNMPLHAAIDCDKDDIVEILLSYSRLTNPTLANEDGHNALHLACIKGKTRLISKILLVSPELINVSNKRGFAPIHLAVFHNQVIALRLILEQKFIHVNGRIMRNRDYNSFTALHLAVSKMFPKCVETLIDQGKAELSLTEDINQMTPFHVAVENLIKTGGKFSVENLFHLQQIPPHLANMDELIERCIDCIPLAICCFLIVRGADLSAKNKQMLTPFDILVSDQSCKVLLPTFNSFSVMKTQPASRGVGRNLTNVSSVSRLQSQSNSVMSSGITPSSFPQSSIALSSSSSPPLSAMSDSKTNDVESDVCRACNELKANVRYEPCNHILFCVKCISQQSHKMCSRCDMPIKARIGPTGEVKAVAKSQNSPIDMQCPICMERLKNMAPACGHTLCRECARNLSECPFCRGPMVELRQVFL